MATVALRKRVLLVDCDVRVGTQVQRECEAISDVHIVTSFHAARRLVLQRVPDVLVTNLRLAEFSGLHLVYLASTDAESTIRCLVFSDYFDFRLVQEAQAAGAMYEPHRRCRSRFPPTSPVRGPRGPPIASSVGSPSRFSWRPAGHRRSPAGNLILRSAGSMLAAYPCHVHVARS